MIFHWKNEDSEEVNELKFWYHYHNCKLDQLNLESHIWICAFKDYLNLVLIWLVIYLLWEYGNWRHHFRKVVWTLRGFSWKYSNSLNYEYLGPIYSIRWLQKGKRNSGKRNVWELRDIIGVSCVICTHASENNVR